MKRLLALVIMTAAWSPFAASAADVAIAPAPRPVAVEPASCLRWVWQQYSWYDDCWASRYPYIAGSVVVRTYRR